MNTTDNQIKLLQAFKEGKAVEVLCEDGTWKRIKEEVADFYPFNFATETYRVKPKPKVKPYKNAAEFLSAYEEHGPWLYKLVNSDVVYVTPTWVTDKVVELSGTLTEYKLLSKVYLWAKDDAFCGIEEKV